MIILGVCIIQGSETISDWEKKERGTTDDLP